MKHGSEHIPRPERGRFWKDPLFYGLGTLGVVASTVVYRGVADVDTKDPIEAPSPIATRASIEPSLETSNEKEDHQPLSNLHVLIINDPELHLNDDTTEQEARQKFQLAGKLMYDSSDHTVKMPTSVPILTVDHIPTGKFTDKKTSQYCISSDDINSARRKAFIKAGISLKTRTAVVVNGNPTCNDDAAGWATRSAEGAEMTVYNSELSAHVITHEEGHIEGLNHASVIMCPSNNFGETQTVSMQERSETDIDTLITEKKCGPLRNEDGKINQYASLESVMGDKDLAEFNGKLYNFVEVNQLSPDTAKIQAVTPEPGAYVIGMKRTDLRGIKLHLPNDHPLKKIDSSLTTLNVGFDPIGEGRYTVRTIASGDSTTYDLTYTFPFTPSFDSSRQAIYTDENLGIQISAEPTETADNNRALLRIEAIR